MSSRRNFTKYNDFKDNAEVYDNIFNVYECSYKERKFGSNDPIFWAYWRLLANKNTGSLFELCFESSVEKSFENWENFGHHMINTIECSHDI